MRYLVVLLSIILSCYSCNDNKIDIPKKPDNLIGKSKMIAILYETSVINAAKGSNRKLLENQGLSPEKYVFEKFNIDSLQFAESNLYYSYKPKEYRAIYEEVRKRLEAERAVHQAVLDEEKRVRDSINDQKKKEREENNKNISKDSMARAIKKQEIEKIKLKDQRPSKIEQK